MLLVYKINATSIQDKWKIYEIQISVNEWVSEWLLLIANSAIFSAMSWREPVNFQWDDDDVRFVLDQHAELDYYSASSLKQQVRR